MERVGLVVDLEQYFEIEKRFSDFRLSENLKQEDAWYPVAKHNWYWIVEKVEDIVGVKIEQDNWF